MSKLFLLLILLCSFTGKAESLKTIEYSESDIFSRVYEVVEAKIETVSFIESELNGCFYGLATVKVLSSYSGRTKEQDILTVGFTGAEPEISTGGIYLLVLNKNKAAYYSHCDKPRTLDRELNYENIYLIHRANFFKLFITNDMKNFESKTCEKNVKFLYEDELNSAEINFYKDGLGKKSCRKFTGSYEELKNLINRDLIVKK